jgi:hypothetical protein
MSQSFGYDVFDRRVAEVIVQSNGKSFAQLAMEIENPASSWIACMPPTADKASMHGGSPARQGC